MEVEAEVTGIDAKIDAFFQPFSEAIASIVFYSASLGGHDIKVILIWLVLVSLFFTFYLGFINVRYFKHAVDLVRGKYDKPGDAGQISRFQALTTSLSGTVGLGNIAGVAVAVSVGGPGAAFWMLVMGFFGMTTKFAEVMLGVKYRHHPDPDRPEIVSGGPMYYIRDAFNNRNIPYLGQIMGGFFAACCVLGTLGAASVFQTNQAYQQVVNVTGGAESFLADKGWLFGLGMAVLVGVVIIGGIKSIAAVASKIVPIMGLIYLVAGLVVIGLHAGQIPEAFVTIFESAFGVKAGIGGLMGALLMGVQRATFSNEAGFGTASIAHAAAKTNEPVSQGFVGMLGPFIDTVIICMVTALVITVTGAYESGSGMEGVELTSRAFESGISWFPYVLCLTVFLFAYSTMIAWSYYGVKSFAFLFGEHEWVGNVFKVIFLLFIVVGASASLDAVILFTDAGVFAMTIPNIIGLYFLAPEIKRDVKDYITRIKPA
ncbi:MAG: alanine glycine permease [Micavibrio sp.]|nr:MAG: alanine glycine permease [Micavibrio sp.]